MQLQASYWWVNGAKKRAMYPTETKSNKEWNNYHRHKKVSLSR